MCIRDSFLVLKEVTQIVLHERGRRKPEMSWAQSISRRMKCISNRGYGASLAVAAAVSVTAYVAHKYSSARQQRASQSKSELVANLRTREFFFERTQETCTSTLISFLPSMKERLFALIEPPTLEQLRSAMSQTKQEKLAVWDQRKYLTFARTIASIYAFCLVNMLSRVQVHILGRYLLDESVAKKQNNFDRLEDITLSDGTRLEFLASANYFLSEGLARLSEKVIAACTVVLAQWPLQKRIGLDDLKQIFNSVRSVIEGENFEFLTSLSSLLLPPEETPSSSSSSSSSSSPSFSFSLDDSLQQHAKLTRLINETRDAIESEPFESVLIECLNTEFAELISHLRGEFSSPPSNGIPIAEIFPRLDRQTEAVLDQENNDYLHQLSSSQMLSEFVHELFLNDPSSSYD
eukprot:TRINITY_DN3029_c0_g2_i1.p1 TRINITY_DN3029_c0_g2~~TRINITY_DN3029_c0_g2_i1.p1  ORF type:complete len:406 (-),score=93.05 TRINITY_DN3029_c0_g2_i1:155-1372(-)